MALSVVSRSAPARVFGARMAIGSSAAALGAGVFVLGVATRVPFRGQVLYHWDSVNFALATVRFDVAEGQPHVPGYILYVALGWLGNLVTHDPQVTFVWLSVLFGGLSAAALFYLGLAMYDRRTGIVAALFLLASPLFWFYGEVALPHVVDTFFTILTAYLLYQAWGGRQGYLLAAAPILAVAGGIRPQTVLFLGPLCLLGAARARPRVILAAAGLLAACSALWLAPLLWLAGGCGRYLEVASAFSQAFHYWEPTYRLLRGDASAFLTGGAKLVSYAGYAVGLAALPPLAYALRSRMAARTLVVDPRARFLATWITPAALFYLFVHMGQQGLVFAFLPALLLLGAGSSAALLGERYLGRVNLLVAFAALTVALHAAVFILAPEHLSGPIGQRLLTWSTIRNLDSRYLGMVSTIRAEFRPERTILVGADWRHAGYYLPEYRLVRLPTVGPDGEMVASMGRGDVDRPISARTSGLPLCVADSLDVVLLDGDPGMAPAGMAARRVPLPAGPPLFALSLEPEVELWWQAPMAGVPGQGARFVRQGPSPSAAPGTAW